MKKFLAVFLCLVMCLSLLPLAVLAMDGEAEAVVEMEAAVETEEAVVETEAAVETEAVVETEEAVVETEAAVGEPVLLESEGEWVPTSEYAIAWQQDGSPIQKRGNQIECACTWSQSSACTIKVVYTPDGEGAQEQILFTEEIGGSGGGNGRKCFELPSGGLKGTIWLEMWANGEKKAATDPLPIDSSTLPDSGSSDEPGSGDEPSGEMDDFNLSPDDFASAVPYTVDTQIEIPACVPGPNGEGLYVGKFTVEEAGTYYVNNPQIPNNDTAVCRGLWVENDGNQDKMPLGDKGAVELEPGKTYYVAMKNQAYGTALIVAVSTEPLSEDPGAVEGFKLTELDPTVGKISALLNAVYDAPANNRFAVGFQACKGSEPSGEPVAGERSSSGRTTTGMAALKDVPLNWVVTKLQPGETYTAYSHLTVTDQTKGDVDITDEPLGKTFTTDSSSPAPVVTLKEEESTTVSFPFGDDWPDYNAEGEDRYCRLTQITPEADGWYQLDFDYNLAHDEQFSVRLTGLSETGPDDDELYMSNGWNESGLCVELKAGRTYNLFIESNKESIKDARFLITKRDEPVTADFKIEHSPCQPGTLPSCINFAPDGTVIADFTIFCSDWYEPGYSEALIFGVKGGALDKTPNSGHSPWKGAIPDGKDVMFMLDAVMPGVEYECRFQILEGNEDQKDRKVLAESEPLYFTAPAEMNIPVLYVGENNILTRTAEALNGRTQTAGIAKLHIPADGLYSFSGIYDMNPKGEGSAIELYDTEGNLIAKSDTPDADNFVRFREELTEGDYYVFHRINTLTPMLHIVPINAADGTDAGIEATTDAALEAVQQTVLDLTKNGAVASGEMPDYVEADDEGAALKDAIEKGDTIIGTVTGEEVEFSDADKAAMDEVAGDGAQLIIELDLGVVLKNKYNITLGNITELDQDVYFEIELPDDFDLFDVFGDELPEGVDAEDCIVVVRKHGNITEKRPPVLKKNGDGKWVLSFSSKQFSLFGIYALPQEDDPTPTPTPTPTPAPNADDAPKSPKTGDEAMPALWALLLLGMSAGAVTVLKKKHR